MRRCWVRAGVPRLLQLALPLLLVTLAPPTRAAASAVNDWATDCQCKCTWQAGNKAADCSNQQFTTIPDKLSNEIQNLDLMGNPLYEITHSAFQQVGLSNLKKLVLKGCQLMNIHKKAFNTLGIMIELDLSKNSIKTLHPGMFNDTQKLRWVSINNNLIQKLDDGLFRDLKFLQRVELSDNHIFKIGINTFINVPVLTTFRLDGNNLTHMRVDVVKNLRSLSSLDLHNNPWKCDCEMQAFRNWVLDHNLYTLPTACDEPPRLRKRMWNDLSSSDFACKPTILEPEKGTAVQAVGENITLSCKVTGNPKPEVNWEQNSRTLDVDQRKHGDHRYVIKQSDNDLTRWVNLTIINVKYFDRGDFTCVAKNPAGDDKRTVALTVSRNGGTTASSKSSDLMYILMGVLFGVIVLLVAVSLLCFCFCRRGDSKRHVKSDMHSSNGEALIEGSVIPEMEKSLITTVNPVTKPPRRYDAPPSAMSGGTEMSELNKTLLDNDSVFAPNEDESRSMDFSDHRQQQRPREASGPEPPRGEHRAYPPDLLSFPLRAGQASPAASSASTAPDSSRLPQQSPVHSPTYATNQSHFRTLPYSRSQSPFPSPVCPPVAAPRQGYVTIPRRPRIPSWASTTSNATTALPMAEYVEPVYDNLGLRTTADGSSVLSLNKAGLEQQLSPGMRGRPLPATPGSYQGPLPVLYTPIEEQERAPSPAPSTPYTSTLPRMNGNSLHLQLSPKTAEPQEPVKKFRPRNIPESGSLKRFNGNDDRLTSLSSPLSPNGRIFDTPGANDTLGRSGKIPPRPPPKPKKKSPADPNGPLFEDEGEDGTEV